MADDLRITAPELSERIQAGEHFTILDVRNRQAWEEATDMAAGAIRAPGDEGNKILPGIRPLDPVVPCCTRPDEASSASLAQNCGNVDFTPGL